MPVNNPAPSKTPKRWLSRSLSWGVPIVAVVAATWILQHYLSIVAWRDIAAAWSELPASAIAGSAVAATVSFGMLALFDVLAVRTVVPGRVSDGLAAFTGAVAHALSNTLGLPALTGAAVRYRIYTPAGLGAGDVARIIGLAGMGVSLGFVVVVTAALCWEPAIAHGWGRFPGLALLAALVALPVWLAIRPRTLRLGSWTLAFPSGGTAVVQMLAGGVEMSAAIAALYVLLPPGSAPPFIDFLPVYVGAVLTGVLSHVPGGLGVFEAIMLAAFPPSARAELLAAMLCYRLIYNLVPFALSVVALTAFEWRRRKTREPA
jgi:glycosyltransferase 2 family protein